MIDRRTFATGLAAVAVTLARPLRLTSVVPARVVAAPVCGCGNVIDELVAVLRAARPGLPALSRCYDRGCATYSLSPIVNFDHDRA